jgi:DNA mismatch endonuclease (patch repair protein)
LKPSKREETLESIAFTLNHIFLQDRRCKMADENSKEYHQEESENYLKAAEEEI